MASSSTSSTSEPKDLPADPPPPPYVWVPADHAMGASSFLVAVDAATGMILDPQPTHPEQNKADLEPHDSPGVEPPSTKPAA